MMLFAAGLSYKTAPVQLREQLAVKPSQLVCQACPCGGHFHPLPEMKWLDPAPAWN